MRSGEAHFHKLTQAVFESREPHAFYDVGHESLFEEHTCRGLGKPSCAHVEHLQCVELTYGGAVGTLHVVGIYLQLRLGEHTGIVSAYDVAVGLVGFGLLRTWGDVYPAGESACGRVVHHIFEKLVAPASFGLVADARIRVEAARKVS